MMFVTLLLPVILPYGCPVTFFHPCENAKRETEFFMWVDKMNKENMQYQQVELLKSEEIENLQAPSVESEQNISDNA